MGLSCCHAENTVKVRCKKLENKAAKDKMQDTIGRWGKKNNKKQGEKKKQKRKKKNQGEKESMTVVK